MDEISLESSLLSGYRYNLNFKMSLPEVIRSKNKFSISPSGVLFLSYTPDKSEEISVNYKDTYYLITVRNLYRTVVFFNQIVDWFYDRDLQDLFLRGEQNELIFNSDYNHLNAKVNYRTKSNNYELSAVPDVIRDTFTNNDYEGARIIINSPLYSIPMKRTEIEAILGALTNFSFESKISEMLQAFYISTQLDRIKDISKGSMPSQSQWEK